MVLCIEIDQDTKAKLDQVLKTGHYSDYSQAIAVAIANHAVLHARVGELGRSFFISKADDFSFHRATSQRAKPLREIPTVPLVFLHRISRPTDFQSAPLPSDAFVPGASVPVDRWIFGQHNKLLPAKASCRALAALCAENKGVPLVKAASEIALYAVELGDYLRTIDDKNGFTRDEALAVAFPMSDSGATDKARLRYANQFVASMNKQGQLSGLLADLKLINYVSGKEPRLLLTESGWDFAAMENPVLDCGAHGLPKFSQEEVTFLLNHIRLRVPVEDSAYRTVIGALCEGVNNPEKLDRFLEPLLSTRHEKAFTGAFLATQRSGAISRMADLGLVRKQRDGVKVTYVPTEAAMQYVTNSDTVMRTK